MPRDATFSATVPRSAPRRRLYRTRVHDWRRLRVPPNTATKRALFSGLMASCDALVIMLASLMAGVVYAPGSEYRDTAVLGLMVAVLFVVSSLLRHDYAITRYLSFKGHAKEAVLLWTCSIVSTLVLAFLTKTSDSFSRGATLVLFFTGYGAVMAVRATLVHIVSGRADAGLIGGRNIFLVGDEAMMRAFMARHDPNQAGLRLVGAAVLRSEPGALDDDLDLAAASARVLRPDDVHILVPWSDRAMLESCISTFMRVPASIHLSPERFFDQFDDMHVVRNGSIASLHIVRSPMAPSDVLVKRIFDIMVSSLALLLLSPAFAVVALAIKLDSPGPVLFRQRRYGFNQEPFRILKFRSMRTMEDDRTLRQATTDDPRVTRVGRILRKTNIDELPQLLNVLRGDMSLVGPRPHALAHDQAFERDIALYARRHNVRPGITGWAQVNGWRGETDTPEKVHGRIRHDLHYIDNWSLLLDVTIMVRTLFSRRAYRNAG